MNDQNQIPSDIAAIIEEKRQALIAESKQKEENDKRERAKTEALGKAKYDEYFWSSVQKAPEYLRPYANPLLVEPDFWRIGCGWDSPEHNEIIFEIPGLSWVSMEPKKGNWRWQYAHWSINWESEPRYEWSGYTDDVAYAMGNAKKAVKEFNQYQAEYAAQVESTAKREAEREQERAREREEQEAMQRETEIRSQAQEQAERAEEQALFDMISSDPVAMTLVKTFVFIRQERAGFESQIENANESMYSMENYWSSKASELRRQAADAERRAEEEKSRIQSDLDDAEDKLKKAERENRGW